MEAVKTIVGKEGYLKDLVRNPGGCWSVRMVTVSLVWKRQAFEAYLSHVLHIDVDYILYCG